MVLYTGRKEGGIEKRLGTAVVLRLTKDFHDKWHRVYFDNFFTSKALLCSLESVGVYGCGMCRRDRK